MQSRFARNMAFLRNLYQRGPFERHAFVLTAPAHAPIWEVGDFTNSERPVRDWLRWAIEPYERWLALAERVPDDGVPVARPLTGTHIYAQAFGCAVHYYADNNPAAQPLVFSAEEADRLPTPNLYQCRNLMRIFELAALMRQELGKEAILGPPDIQTGFDTASLIWNKTDFYCALKTAPEAVHRLVAKCASLLRDFLRVYAQEFAPVSFAHCPTVWAPADLGPWVSNDECGALSPAMFETFALPEMIALAEEFGGLGMHCCADADHQFEAFKRIPNFYAFNRVPTKQQGYAAMLKTLGGPEGPVFVPGVGEPTLVAQLLAEAPPGSRFIFSCPYLEPEAAQRWLDEMHDCYG